MLVLKYFQTTLVKQKVHSIDGFISDSMIIALDAEKLRIL